LWLEGFDHLDQGLPRCGLLHLCKKDFPAPSHSAFSFSCFHHKNTAMHIIVDQLTHPAVHALLEEHLANMRAISPPCRVHALDLAKLRAPGITFWSAWEDDALVGVGALKALSATQGEIKSMRTPAARRRAGAGRALLMHILAQAKARGYTHLYLETGATAAFTPAQTLYQSAGFTVCGPFADYLEDPHSMFMVKQL
jgi:putative acetyltransferase